MKKFLLISLLFTTTSIAAHAVDNNEAWFKKADTNGDAIISREEAAAANLNRFDAIDTNKDGQISLEEKRAFKEQRKEERKAELDTNGDGKITADERAAFKKEAQENRTNNIGSTTPANTVNSNTNLTAEPSAGDKARDNMRTAPSASSNMRDSSK